MKTPTQNNDRFDVLQTQQGDEEAFTRLVERHQVRVFNLCYQMLGDPACAEDASQESFLRAYLNINRFDPGRSFGSWLLSITAHYCIDRLRRRKIGFLSIDQCEDDDDHPIQLPDARAVHPEVALEHSQEQHALQQVLGKLKASDRAAIVLRYWYEYSGVEIAEALDISVPAVKARLFRARREIAVRLEEKRATGFQSTPFCLAQTRR